MTLGNELCKLKQNQEVGTSSRSNYKTLFFYRFLAQRLPDHCSVLQYEVFAFMEVPSKI